MHRETGSARQPLGAEVLQISGRIVFQALELNPPNMAWLPSAVFHIFPYMRSLWAASSHTDNMHVVKLSPPFTDHAYALVSPPTAATAAS